MISQDSIEQLKQRIDIVDLIQRFVDLKKQGGTYKGLCPFHGEKTPSFIVTPSRNLYKCFGCGVSGDGIKFIMELEHLGFAEAIERIAEMYHFTLQYDQDNRPKRDPKIMESLLEYYKKVLLTRPDVVHYLRERGVHESIMERFELGYAPASQETVRFFTEQFMDKQEGLNQGLLRSDNGRIYAHFIERLLFPIHTHNGKIVGFGGRTLTNHPAKYVNSPETPFFKKSQLLYGYHLARETILKQNRAILVEGYMDVIMLHQAGFTNAVAAMGTALSSDNIKHLTRGDAKVVLAYDGDRAGRKAAYESARQLALQMTGGGVVLFEEGLDPADMVKNHQVEQLKSMLAHPKAFVPYCLEHIVDQVDSSDPLERQKALDDAQNFLKQLPPLLQEEYAPYLASLLGTDLRVVTPAPARTPRYSSAQNRPQPRIRTTRYDPYELSILKTMALEPALIDTVLEFVDSSAFAHHGTEFQLILDGGMEDDRLAFLMLDETIQAYDEEGLRRNLLLFLIKQYTEQLQRIKQSSIELSKKSFLIRDHQQKIARLKKEELIPFESIRTE